MKQAETLSALAVLAATRWLAGWLGGEIKGSGVVFLDISRRIG